MIEARDEQKHKKWCGLWPAVDEESWSRSSKALFFSSYLFFGVLHELAHVATARSLGYQNESLSLSFFVGILLGRVSVIPSLEFASAWEIALVRHAGWLASFVILAFLFLADRLVAQSSRRRNKRGISRMFLGAAAVTFLEALSTDLIGFGVARSKASSKILCFCGNFGIIMLNDSWVNTSGDYGKTVLDLLEKMISITMMRGAQAGGIVAWTHRQGGSPMPVRVRVVNRKRTDLSHQMRKEINDKLCSSWCGRTGQIDSSVRVLLGHTRFATSSKATMDGTHPHSWCPPQFRRVFPLDNSRVWSSRTPYPIHMKVSNFITHNGDFDFYKLNGKHAHLTTIQEWLVEATGFPMPAPVDSAAIAGFVDIIRCAGCFALSIRYVHLLAMPSSKISLTQSFPSYMDYDRLSKIFEKTLLSYCKTKQTNLEAIGKDRQMRNDFSLHVVVSIQSTVKLEQSAFFEYCENIDRGNLDHDEDDDLENVKTSSKKSKLFTLVKKSVDAFFDNDLLLTTRLFMKSAVGSFGLMVTSSLDSHRQICLSARGQPMSCAFFPDKGIICYGSELAAVKAGLQFDRPGGNFPYQSMHGSSSLFSKNVTEESCRFDLDDLGGEIVLIDWSSGQADIQTHQESRSSEKGLRSRVTPLRGNEFLLPLTPDFDDPIAEDIGSIPRVLHSIQEKWKKGGLNRLTAWNLGRKLRERLMAQASGRSESGVDILLTGCEVSLWLAEQLASDLSKSFPKLTVQAASSNKLLGLMGQELSVPSVGFPMSDKIPDLKNTIVIIVSHSGGTFASLAISNLLQSVTRNIFVVASEWDSQIGKQLRAMFEEDKDIFGSRVFTTDIGVRPAEPCSLSVAATHQLLTQIFEYICLVILSDQIFRDLTGAVITEPDLRILERCNQDNIVSLERIVGREVAGTEHQTEALRELKEAGDLWADHVLEVARAYIMSFVYIVATVTSGYPLITGIAMATGLLVGHWGFYLTRFLDALIYFFLPQINIIIIRLIQKRNLLHRMTGRTVVVGDIPWVAQSAEAFLSKIFARSYSIAGLSVLSGNPSDHLVHRHTHRVVRGTLLVCGRPDGRLTALTSAECAVNLSVNQASSIQSIGGTCESITIGHNPAELGLTYRDIALSTYRPKFLCEQILDVMDDAHLRKQQALSLKLNPTKGWEETTKVQHALRWLKARLGISSWFEGDDHSSSSRLDRSSHSLKGAYLGMREQSQHHLRPKRTANRDASGNSANSGTSTGIPDDINVSKEIELLQEDFDETSAEEAILAAMLAEKQRASQWHQVFNEIDADGSGTIDLEEFIVVYNRVQEGLSRDYIESIFREADVEGKGELDYKGFERVMSLGGSEVIRRLHHANQRNEKGLLEVKPSTESYFGAEMHNNAPPGINSFAQAQSQHFSMELYESRIASLQRFTAMCVMFHQMGKRVQDFFPKYSLGLLGYKMERTQSIMRIATTASPVSGDAVREQMQLLKTRARITNAANLIMDRWKAKQKERMKQLRRDFSARQMLRSDLSTRSLVHFSPLQSQKKQVTEIPQAATGRLSSSFDALFPNESPDSPKSTKSSPRNSPLSS